jgi:hypothetical protein
VVVVLVLTLLAMALALLGGLVMVGMGEGGRREEGRQGRQRKQQWRDPSAHGRPCGSGMTEIHAEGRAVVSGRSDDP